MTTSTVPGPSAGIPFVPDSAPFTPAQRAWLNGLLAGMFSGMQPGQTAAPPVAAPVKVKVPVFFGSESGNAEALSKRLAKTVQQRGFESKAIGLDKISVKDLANEKFALIITSTFGEGDPPENAKAFHAELHAADHPGFANLSYSVLALGDKNYEQFCKCGVDIDKRLEALGARRLYERVDCDIDYEASYERWQTGVLGVLEAAAKSASPGATPATSEPPPGTHGAPAIIGDNPVEAGHVPGPTSPGKTGTSTHPGQDSGTRAPPPKAAYSRKNPFPAKLLTNRCLSAEGSGKEVRHYEISLAGSGLAYEAGDALGVVPANCPALVDELLHTLNCDGEEAVPTPDGQEDSLRIALERHYEITRIPAPLLKAIAERSSDRTLADLMRPEEKEALGHYLWGREVLDLLADFPSVTFTPAEFVSHLKKLQPRLYSISSSLKAFPEQVHLTVSTLRYESFGRKRKGVCSTFLADRVDGTVPVFVQVSHSFRLPTDGDTPIIMVGPGTGVAPFRAFLHERRAVGAKGRNWLFFGEQHAATDFYYREELDPMLTDGHLSKLSTAFSRDQKEKIYVQHRMWEARRELFAWLEEGAALYVCGDAKSMAKDVQATLQRMVAEQSGRSEEGSAEYLRGLQKSGRYLKDVY